MSPPTGSGDILFFPVRLSVRPSVRPSVRASVRPSVRHKSCPLYNLKTVKDFSMKLGTLVNHDKTMCRAQEPQLWLEYFWSYSPLIIFNIISCPVYNLKNV